MISRINKFYKKYAYLIYLCTLVFWIGFLALFEKTGWLIELELFSRTMIIISAFYFFHNYNKKFIANIYTPIVLIFSFLEYFIHDNLVISRIDRVLLLIYFLIITIHLLKKIFKHKEVDDEMIYISIAAYIMIGLMSSILCWFVYNTYPNSYNIAVNPDGPLFDFIYYSIVTMTTLGYGDILPTSPQSKSLAIVITLVGQFYMAILVAFLIGKFLNQRK